MYTHTQSLTNERTNYRIPPTYTRARDKYQASGGFNNLLVSSKSFAMFTNKK